MLCFEALLSCGSVGPERHYATRAPERAHHTGDHTSLNSRSWSASACAGNADDTVHIMRGASTRKSGCWVGRAIERGRGHERRNSLARSLARLLLSFLERLILIALSRARDCCLESLAIRILALCSRWTSPAAWQGMPRAVRSASCVLVQQTTQQPGRAAKSLAADNAPSPTPLVVPGSAAAHATGRRESGACARRACPDARALSCFASPSLSLRGFTNLSPPSPGHAHIYDHEHVTSFVRGHVDADVYSQGAPHGGLVPGLPPLIHLFLASTSHTMRHRLTYICIPALTTFAPTFSVNRLAPDYPLPLLSALSYDIKFTFTTVLTRRARLHISNRKNTNHAILYLLLRHDNSTNL